MLINKTLFSTTCSTAFSTILSTIFKNIKIQSISTFLKNYLACNYFYTRHLTLLLHFKKKLVLSIAEALVRNINLMDEVCNISNKYQPPSNLAKYQYFYTRNFISFLHFEIKLAHSIVNVFQNIHFYQIFTIFNHGTLILTGITCKKVPL